MIIQLNLVSKLRMSGDINPLPFYAFMVCVCVENFHFTFTDFVVHFDRVLLIYLIK